MTSRSRFFNIIWAWACSATASISISLAYRAGMKFELWHIYFYNTAGGRLWRHQLQRAPTQAHRGPSHEFSTKFPSGCPISSADAGDYYKHFTFTGTFLLHQYTRPPRPLSIKKLPFILINHHVKTLSRFRWRRRDVYLDGRRLVSPSMSV